MWNDANAREGPFLPPAIESAGVLWHSSQPGTIEHVRCSWAAARTTARACSNCSRARTLISAQEFASNVTLESAVHEAKKLCLCCIHLHCVDVSVLPSVHGTKKLAVCCWKAASDGLFVRFLGCDATDDRENRKSKLRIFSGSQLDQSYAFLIKSALNYVRFADEKTVCVKTRWRRRRSLSPVCPCTP